METGKIGIIILLLIFIIPLPIIGAETEVKCTGDTIPDRATGQCILACGEGISATTLPNGTIICEQDPAGWGDSLGQIEVIAGGIITGVLATAFGIIWTIKVRRDERRKEDMELIQNYGNQISEIVNEEQNLETQLDCGLYAERYLDTLDQIASLNYKKMLRRDVADYFENNFKYGIHLWKWYKKNIEKIPETLLDIIFTKGVLDPYDWVKEIRAKNQTLNWKQYYDDKEEADDDRWFYFRWWCNFEENV